MRLALSDLEAEKTFQAEQLEEVLCETLENFISKFTDDVGKNSLMFVKIPCDPVKPDVFGSKFGIKFFLIR